MAENFLNKVNECYNKGLNSNPEFSKAIDAITKIAKERRNGEPEIETEKKEVVEK